MELSPTENNLFLTALQLNDLMLRDAKTDEVSTYISHPEMSWPDTLAWAPDGSLYLVTNHLNVRVDGDMDFDNPPIPNFRIWKIQPAQKTSARQ